MQAYLSTIRSAATQRVEMGRTCGERSLQNVASKPTVGSSGNMLAPERVAGDWS